MNRLKRYVTDIVCYVLTAGLACECASWLAGHALDEDTFVAEAPAFAFALLCAVVLAGLAARYVRGITTLGRKLFDPAATGRAWRWQLALLFVLTFTLSLRVTQASWRELLDARGMAGAIRLWSGLAHPNLSLLPKAVAQAAETVLIAFLATTLAVPLAFVLAFFAAKNLVRSPLQRAIYGVLRLSLNVIRSVEPLIWALVFTVWVGVGPFAGMLALLVHATASLTKYYSEIIEGVPDGPLDAVRSTGATPFQVVWYAVVPQVTLPYIAMTVYRWDTNVRMATVIGLVGGGGIGTLLIQYQGQAMWPEVGCIILVIAVIIWILDFASAQIRDALK